MRFAQYEVARCGRHMQQDQLVLLLNASAFTHDILALNARFNADLTTMVQTAVRCKKLRGERVLALCTGYFCYLCEMCDSRDEISFKYYETCPNTLDEEGEGSLMRTIFWNPSFLNPPYSKEGMLTDTPPHVKT